MRVRPVALGLALGLTLSLTACGGQEDTPSPSPSLAVSQETVQPSESPAVSEAPTATPAPDAASPAPDETSPSPIPDKGTPPPSDDPTETPATQAATSAPTSTPSPTPTPSAAPTPTPTPTPTPAPAAVSAKEVYDAVAKAAGSTSLTDMGAVLEGFYNISADDLEDYALYQPAMSANIEEIFIARAKPGKVDALKSACQDRLEGLKEDGEFYPETAAYLDGARVETSGDWVLLAVCPDADSAVKAFQDGVK